MIIRKVNIHKFGRLSNENIGFQDGLNLIYGPNESGKSTLQGFLLNMLFGMTRSKGKASKTDEYTRFEPADEPQNYSGALTFESGGREYLLRRDFAAGKRKDMLLCTETGEILSEEDGDLSALLGDISRRTYSNTQSVDQTGQTDPDYLLETLRDRDSGVPGQGDGVLSDALEALGAKRRQLESGSRKTGKEAEEVLKRLAVKIEYARTDLSEKREQLDKIAKFRRTPGSAGKQNAERKDESFRIPPAAVLSAFAAAFCLLAVFFLPETKKISAILFMACLALAVICVTAAALRYGKKRRNAPLPRQVKSGGYEWQADYLRNAIREKESFLEGLQEQYEQEALKKADAAGMQEKIDGLRLAEETLIRVGNERSAETARHFRAMTERNYQLLTGQADGRLAFSGNEISLLTEKGAIPFWQCSKGTRALLKLSVRLAAADLLIQDEPMPVLLDDVFVHFDEERLKRALQLLARKKRQVLIFTCQRREETLLNALHIPYYAVAWSGNAG